MELSSSVSFVCNVCGRENRKDFRELTIFQLFDGWQEVLAEASHLGVTWETVFKLPRMSCPASKVHGPPGSPLS